MTRNTDTPPPPDWYDWVAVERTLAGEPVGRKLTKAERAAVIAHHRSHGNATRLARALRCSGATARRHLTTT
ncbi:hypothetical protein [Sciscionella sediminilitoris]|uniref:hypothetical protein n=1 Tax=Sciscionella sediminilitoris TaxID=1445613 RepID=UPI0004DEF24A|nr:hypothetical protein [Sciscionella sp. SE31]